MWCGEKGLELRVILEEGFSLTHKRSHCLWDRWIDILSMLLKQFTSLHLLSALGCLLPMSRVGALESCSHCPLLGLICYCISFGSRDCMKIHVCLYILWTLSFKIKYIKLSCFLFLSLPWPLQFQCESSKHFRSQKAHFFPLWPLRCPVLAASFCCAVQQTTPSLGASASIAVDGLSRSRSTTSLLYPDTQPQGWCRYLPGKTDGKQVLLWDRIALRALSHKKAKQELK